MGVCPRSWGVCVSGALICWKVIQVCIRRQAADIRTLLGSPGSFPIVVCSLVCLHFAKPAPKAPSQGEQPMGLWSLFCSGSFKPEVPGNLHPPKAGCGRWQKEVRIWKPGSLALDGTALRCDSLQIPPGVRQGTPPPCGTQPELTPCLVPPRPWPDAPTLTGLSLHKLLAHRSLPQGLLWETWLIIGCFYFSISKVPILLEHDIEHAFTCSSHDSTYAVGQAHLVGCENRCPVICSVGFHFHQESFLSVWSDTK